MTDRHLLVLGATGKTGQNIVRLALERDWHVTAIVRAESVAPEGSGLTIVSGSVLDPQILDDAMTDQHAVISCLGLRRKSPTNPWSAIISPPDLVARSAKNTVEAMRAHGVTRLVAMSAAGVGDSRPMMSLGERVGVSLSKIAVHYRDFENMERIYQQGHIDCLVVRPVKMNDDPANNKATIVDRLTTLSRVTRNDVARWMLDALDRPPPFDHFAEMIGEPRG